MIPSVSPPCATDHWAIPVLIVTLPVYKKALRKIKTSVEVEDNGKLEAIDISGE